MTNYAIIAGKGDLPVILAESLPDAKIVCIDGEENQKLKADLVTKFGQVGKFIDFLKQNNVTNLIFAGAMKKPNLSDIIPDVEGTKLLAKIMAGKIFGGDDKLLTTIIKFLEGKGFKVVGAHEVVPQILAEEGFVGSVRPVYVNEIGFGLKEAQKLGRMDIGQAVVVENSKVIACEDENGTENLIKRAGKVKTTKAAYLVKACKPQQDKRIDLPAIGLDTIQQLKDAGLAGVAVEAGKSIIINKQQVLELADKLGIFVYGVK